MKKYEFADSECENAKRNNPGRWRERKHKEKGNNECEQHTNNDSAGRRWAERGTRRRRMAAQREGARGGFYVCLLRKRMGGKCGQRRCVYVSVWLLAVAKATKQK